MSTLKIKIDTDNAAFDDALNGHAGRAAEVARILRAYADSIENKGDLHPCFLIDINGNTVGHVIL